MASTSSLAPVCRGPCFLRTSEFRKAGQISTATGAPLLKRRKEWHCFAKQHWLAAGIGGREESKRRVPEFGVDSTFSGIRRKLHRQVHARSQDEQSNLSSRLENREQTDVQSPGHSGSASASSSKPPIETSTTHSDAEVGSSEGNGVSEGARAVSASAAEVVGGAELPPDFWEDTYLPATTRRDLEAASPLQTFLFPDKEELPDDVEMSVWDHLEELRQRVFVSVGAVGACILLCFAYANQLVKFLEAPVASTGVRFLQLSPGEYFFVTLKAAGYSGLLLGSPVILYEIVAFVLPGLTRSERRFLAPIVLGSSVLFYAGLAFSYNILVPAALNFFVTYAENVVESIWSIDQYFEFVLVLLFSTGLAFQVPVIQLLLGSTGLFNSQQMFSIWKYVVVGAVVAAAVLTPSTDPLTQILLAGPLIGLYFGGAAAVRLTERAKGAT